MPLATITPVGSLTFCSGKSVLLKANTGTGYTYQWKKGTAIIRDSIGSTFVATTAGAYSVVVTNTSGCSVTSDAKTVVVNPVPLATITPVGSLTFCSDKSVLLKANTGTGYTYQWKKGNVVIRDSIGSALIATASGIYTVVITNVEGCSTTSAGITVTVNPAPAGTITASGPLSFPQGGNVVLKAPAGTGYTYQWKKDGLNINNAISQNYTATLSGSYTVVVTNSNGCPSTSQPVQVSVISGRLITKGLNDEAELIHVYPNPLHGDEYLNIEWSEINTDKGLHVTVFDATGRLIETKQLNPYNKKIRIKGASGMYFVNVTWGENQRKVFKVIKIE